MPELLETLVKLAAAGTSGICIFAIFTVAYILFKSNKDTPSKKYDALKSFMNMAIIIAVISAGTTIAAGYWDYKTKISLKGENKELAEMTKKQENTITKTKEAAVAINDQLVVKDSAIASLRKDVGRFKAGEALTQVQLDRLNNNIKKVNLQDLPELPAILNIPKRKNFAVPPQ